MRSDQLGLSAVDLDGLEVIDVEGVWGGGAEDKNAVHDVGEDREVGGVGIHYYELSLN